MADDYAAALTARMLAARAVRLAQGKNPDTQPPSDVELNRARAAKEDSIPGTEEYAMREERLAAIEDRKPRHVLRR